MPRRSAGKRKGKDVNGTLPSFFEKTDDRSCFLCTLLRGVSEKRDTQRGKEKKNSERTGIEPKKEDEVC